MNVDHYLQQTDNPELKAPQRDEPKAMRYWLEHLPKTNIIKTAPLVHQALVDMDYQTHKQADSLPHYFQINVAINDICNLLQSQYLEPSITTEKKHALFRLAEQLHRQMAIIFSWLAEQASFELTQSQQATIIEQAISHLTDIVLRHYQTYHSIPDTIWQSIYDLYQYAQLHQLLTQRVTHKLLGHSFHRILLLATVSPYQLRPKELAHTLDYLSKWTDLVTINDTIESTDLYAMNLTSDTAPCYAKLLDTQQSKNQFHGINLQRLIDHLQSLKQNNTDSVVQPLIHHLLHVWQPLPKRHTQRSVINSPVQVCVGLVSSHFHINEKISDIVSPKETSRPSNADTDSEIKTSDSSGKVENLDHDELSELLKADYQIHWHRNITKRGPNNNIIQRRSIPKKEKVIKPQKDPICYTWQLINQSDEGYCISLSHDHPPGMKVDKIIATRIQSRQSKQQYWHISLIRWIRYMTQSQLCIGVKNLAPAAITIGLQNQQQYQDNYRFTRGLLLFDSPTANEPTSILVPSMPYKSSDQLRIANQLIDSDIKLTQHIYKSKFFSLFQFDVIEHFANELINPAQQKRLQVRD